MGVVPGQTQVLKTWRNRCTQRFFLLLLAVFTVLCFVLSCLFSLSPFSSLSTLATQGSDENRSTYSLREFESTVDEETRLVELLLKRDDARPPNLTPHNCTGLIMGQASHPNADPHSSTASDNSKTSSKSRSLQDVLAATENCTRYVLQSGFRFAKVSEEELSFPLAFSLIVYKDLDQVERVLRALYRPHNVYCIHADRKADVEFHSGLRLIVGCLPNVYMTDTSVDVQWGEISVLEPEMECMRRLLAHRARWRYFINLTGQEFPLKTNKELVRIFGALRGANIVIGTTDKKFHSRWESPKPVPYNLTVNKGDVHVVVSRGYVDYVTNSRVARELYAWLRDSYIPDETFFSTMNFNPQLGVPGSYTGPMAERSYTSPRYYKIWDFRPDRNKCKGKFVRFICHFGVGDLPSLTSSQFLIANKFSYDYQPLAYDCLEQWYFGKVRQENQGVVTPLNLSVYENSEFVRYRYTGPVLIWD